MSELGPFGVSASGVSVQQANGPQALLSASAPMSKLDVTNIHSFETVQILLNHEPPQAPSGGGFTDTQIDQFKHGYTYIPAVMMTWQQPAPQYPSNPPSGGTALTLFDFGDDTASSNIPGVGGTSSLSLFAEELYTSTDGSGTIPATKAFFYITVDATNVTLYIRKVGQLIPNLGTSIPIYLIGTFANMRYYIFAEPGTTSTY